MWNIRQIQFCRQPFDFVTNNPNVLGLGLSSGAHWSSQDTFKKQSTLGHILGN